MRMKILIGYDGSPCADIALHDLERAGLPSDAEATVLSVADVWLVPADVGGKIPGSNLPIVQEASATAARLLAEAHTHAVEGAELVQEKFPNWLVRAESCADSPAWGLILKGEEWQPDLIVVGSHNQSPLRRLMLGSVSHTVMTQARCSVRIARAWGATAGRPLRILVGVDGSLEAEAAVHEVAARCWPPGSDIHLITVVDPSMLTAVASGSLRHKAEEELQTEELNTIIDGMLTASADIVRLRAPGMAVSTQLHEGDPRHVLVEEAERWGADCIFVGSRGLNRLERLLFGSVATAVATRAPCSVEVVRPTSAFIGASHH